MKKLALVLAALLCGLTLTVAASAAEAPAVLDSADLYITFDNESIADTKGNYTVASNGMFGAVDATFVEGKFGTAAQCASAENFLTVEGLKFDTNSFTIATWVFVENYGGDPCLFSNQDWDSIENLGFSLAIDGYGDGFRAAGNSSGSSAFSLATGVEITGEWVHIALVMDRESGVASMYINGEASPVTADISGHTSHFNGGYPFNIGDDGEGKYNSSSAFTANFDEFMVFKSALSADDVKAIYEYDPTAADEEPVESGSTDEPSDEPSDEPAIGDDGTIEEPDEKNNTGLIIGIAAAVVVVAAIALAVVLKKKK